MRHQALRRSETLGERDQPERAHEALRRREAAGDLERDHAAAARLLPDARARAAGSSRSAGMRDRRDPRIGVEPPRERQGARAVPLHPELERLQAAEREPGLLRRLDAAGRVAGETQPLGERRLVDGIAPPIVALCPSRYFVVE